MNSDIYRSYKTNHNISKTPAAGQKYKLGVLGAIGSMLTCATRCEISRNRNFKEERPAAIDKRAQFTCSCISVECEIECPTTIDKSDVGRHSGVHFEAADIDKLDFGTFSKCCLRTSAGHLTNRTLERTLFVRKVRRFSRAPSILFAHVC